MTRPLERDALGVLCLMRLLTMKQLRYTHFVLTVLLFLSCRTTVETQYKPHCAENQNQPFPIPAPRWSGILEIPREVLIDGGDKSMGESYGRLLRTLRENRVPVSQTHPIWNKRFAWRGFAIVTLPQAVDAEGSVIEGNKEQVLARKKKLGDTAFSPLRALYQANKGRYRSFVFFVARELSPKALKQDALTWESRQRRQICRIPWKRKRFMRRKPKAGIRAWVIAYDFIVADTNGAPRQEIPSTSSVEQMLEGAGFPSEFYQSAL